MSRETIPRPWPLRASLLPAFPILLPAFDLFTPIITARSRSGQFSIVSGVAYRPVRQFQPARVQLIAYFFSDSNQLGLEFRIADASLKSVALPVMMLGEPGASGRDTAAITLDGRLGRELVVGTRVAEVDRGRVARVGGCQLPTDLRSLRLGAGLEQSRSSGRWFDFGPIRLLLVGWLMLGSRVKGTEARIEVSARGARDFGRRRGVGAETGGGGRGGSFVLFPSLGASALHEPFPRVFAVVVVVVAVARRFRFHGVPFHHHSRRLDEVRGAEIGLAAELLRIEGGSARVARVVATRSIIVAVDTSGAGSKEVRGGAAPLSKRRRRMIVALQRETRDEGNRGQLLASFRFASYLRTPFTLARSRDEAKVGGLRPLIVPPLCMMLPLSVARSL